MSKLEIVGTNYRSNGVMEYSQFTPELNKDLSKLIDNLPVGAKVGIECSQEIMEGFADDSTDAVDLVMTRLDRKLFFEKIIDKCREKEIDVVCLLDENLCKKGEIISKNWNYFDGIGESLELGFDSQTEFEVETKNGEKIIKPYFKLNEISRNNFNYWKFVELPDRIFQKVNEGDFDLVVLSQKTLGYFVKQRPSLVDYSKIDVRGISVDELDYWEEIHRRINGVVVENKTLRKSKLVQYNFENYPEEKIRNEYGYRPGDREEIIANYLATSDIVIR